MPASDPDITETDLRAAFQRCGLWRRGWNYRRAITTEIVARCLRNTALAMRRSSEQLTGKPAPRQRALI